LAGVAAGLRCEAVVNAPREARCLVVKRDGSGSELLRPADVARLRREAGYAGDSPYVGRAEVAEGGALDDTLNATLSATLASTGLGATGTPGKRRATMKADDSEDLASKQHVLVRRHDVGASNCVFAAAFGPLAHESDWATRPLPHAARDEADWPAEPAASAAPRVRVVRVVVEQKALSEDGRSLMRCAMLDSAAWVARRAAEMDRFSVADPRPAEARPAAFLENAVGEPPSGVPATVSQGPFHARRGDLLRRGLPKGAFPEGAFPKGAFPNKAPRVSGEAAQDGIRRPVAVRGMPVVAMLGPRAAAWDVCGMHPVRARGMPRNGCERVKTIISRVF